MKALLILLMICALVAPVWGQRQETIFSGPITSGGYGGAIVKFSDIDGESGIWVGGKGGWIINHSLVIGGGGFGLVSDNKELYLIDGRTRRLTIGYGGLILEYVHNSHKLVHFTGGVLIGAGGAGHIYRDDYYSDWGTTNADAFFALEPNFGIELNIARYIRAELGASYLYTSGIELSDTEDEDISGPMGYLALKFGSF